MIIAGLGLIGTAGSGSVTPTYASTFSVAISPASGASGNNVTVTVAPIGGAWPANQPIVGTYSGTGASFASASVVAGSTSPVSFTGTVTAGSGTTGMINATISGMTSTGGQTYTATATSVYVPPTPSAPAGQVTKAELISSKSAVSPGTPVSFRIVPNGNWAGSSLTLGIAKGTGTLSATTIATPNSGNATLTFTYTPNSLGEHAITLTGAGLYSPWPHPLCCFTPNNGSPQTFGASLVLNDMTPHQFDVWGSKPFGFDSMDCSAWGEVPMVPSTSGPAIFARFYDGLSSGATSTAGTGTPLHSAPIQVYGAFTAGNTIIPLLPGSRRIYFADFATDAAFTNPFRLAKRFSVGLVMATNQRSMECGIARAYSYSGTSVPTGQTFATTVTNVAFDNRYGYNNAWFRHDGVSANPDPNMYGEASSAGTQRIGELVDHYLGLTFGITGCSQAGGDIPDHIRHDGSPSPGFTDTVPNVRGKFRWFWTNNVGWNNTSDPDYPNETVAEDTTRLVGNVDYTMKQYPACSVVGFAYGEQGFNLYNASAKPAPQPGWPGGELRFAKALRAQMGVHVVDKGPAGLINGNQPNSHPGQSARTTYAESGFRALYAGELAAFGGLQTNLLGPTFTSGGTIVRGSNIIRVPFAHNGTSLVGLAVSYDPNNPTRNFQTATPAELASIFTIYTGPGGCDNTSATVLQVSSVTIDNANKQFVITLTSGQTVPDYLTLQFNCQWGASNPELGPPGPAPSDPQHNIVPRVPYRAAFIADDRTDTSIGLQFGWHMHPAFDIEITTAG